MYLVKCLLVVISEETIIQPQDATVGQFMRDKNVPFLFNGQHEWSETFGVAYIEKLYLSKIFSSTQKHRSIILSISVFWYECSCLLKSLKLGIRDDVCS